MRDPIAHVLDALWADATTGGRAGAVAMIHEALAGRDYAAALMLAIAIELDDAKRDESRRFWSQPDIDKLALLDELGKRHLFDFLCRHINDWRQMRRPPCGGPPPMSG